MNSKRKTGGRCGKELRGGVSTSLEFCFLFLEFANNAGTRLSPALIEQHYQCSRATSYRWYAAYKRFKEREFHSDVKSEAA